MLKRANNQQERSDIESWIVGFTDGEGCFSVSIIKNHTSKAGWQVFPEFVITQGKKSISALKIFQKYFQCGKIYENKRYDNHNEHLYRYCVRSIRDLQNVIIPFFKKHKLRTAKSNDFESFANILALMEQRKHLEEKGLKKIAKIIETMNRKKKSQFLESSEAKCCAP